MIDPLRKAAEMALNYFENAYELDSHEIEIRAELRQALAQINPDICSGYAGVRIWIGDKTIQYSVTKVCLEQEMIEGLSMKLAFDSCLKALKEKNT